MLSKEQGSAEMNLRCQLMAREKGDESFEMPCDLKATEMEAAKVEAKAIFATARRMAVSSGNPEPKSVRITEYDVEMWRWTWSQEASAPRKKRP